MINNKQQNNCQPSVDAVAPCEVRMALKLVKGTAVSVKPELRLELRLHLSLGLAPRAGVGAKAIPEAGISVGAKAPATLLAQLGNKHQAHSRGGLS